MKNDAAKASVAFLKSQKMADSTAFLLLFADVTQQIRSDGRELPSWEGLGVGCRWEDAANMTTHPLPLPGGELSATLRNISK